MMLLGLEERKEGSSVVGRLGSRDGSRSDDGFGLLEANLVVRAVAAVPPLGSSFDRVPDGEEEMSFVDFPSNVVELDREGESIPALTVRVLGSESGRRDVNGVDR